MIILDVVRHGESELNLQGRYAGSTDTPLTSEGLRQAEELAAKIVHEEYDLVVTSPLLRARATAEILHRGRQTPLVTIAEFSERNVGAFEGLTRAEAERDFPEQWQRNILHQVDEAPAGGETLRQLSQRVALGLTRLQNEYSAQKILLVCHGAVGRELNRRFRNLPFERLNEFALANCEIVRYELTSLL